MMNGRQSGAFRKGRAFVVGVTSDGCVLFLEAVVAGTRRPILTLPSISIGLAGFSEGDLKDQLGAYLLEEFGYGGRALLRMRSEPAGGPAHRELIFLAPLLAPAGPRRRPGFGPTLRQVPLAVVPRYLVRRSCEGALVDQHVWRGCVLAEERFPQWAREQLVRAIAVLEARRAKVSATA